MKKCNVLADYISCYIQHNRIIDRYSVWGKQVSCFVLLLSVMFVYFLLNDMLCCLPPLVQKLIGIVELCYFTAWPNFLLRQCSDFRFLSIPDLDYYFIYWLFLFFRFFFSQLFKHLKWTGLTLVFKKTNVF